jgi:hypothetical protein
MSPELTASRLVKRAEAGRSSDMFAFGIVCWEVLSGRAPWDGMADSERLERLRAGESLDLAALTTAGGGTGVTPVHPAPALVAAFVAAPPAGGALVATLSAPRVAFAAHVPLTLCDCAVDVAPGETPESLKAKVQALLRAEGGASMGYGGGGGGR